MGRGEEDVILGDDLTKSLEDEEAQYHGGEDIIITVGTEQQIGWDCMDERALRDEAE